ncbi:DELTA-stichotoxin-Hcr4a-like [Brachyhypopomus gauderio]|uniref:DELTA-stichotoxin-Hcr4a-like n=1 Tax=Brachyhypopomus gauderio TaxID=698409 RepID=UPI0040423F04
MAFTSAIIPGASLTGTSAEQISQGINTGRNVVIEISNFSDTYTLGNPKVHTSSGYCLSPPQPTIQKKTKEACSFTKTSDTACGAVGVLTYQMLTNESYPVGELAIMFSVPYDYNMYENWFALGIFNAGLSCNDDLFKKMYYDPSTNHSTFTRGKGTGSEITFSGGKLCIKGTMSPAGKSIMKVEFWDRLF